MSSIVCNQVYWSEYLFVYTETSKYLLKDMTATTFPFSKSNYFFIWLAKKKMYWMPITCEAQH